MEPKVLAMWCIVAGIFGLALAVMIITISTR